MTCAEAVLYALGAALFAASGGLLARELSKRRARRAWLASGRAYDPDAPTGPDPTRQPAPRDFDPEATVNETRASIADKIEANLRAELAAAKADAKALRKSGRHETPGPPTKKGP